MKKNILSPIIFLVIFICIIGCSNSSTSQNGGEQNPDSISVQTASLYFCPMDTDVKSDKPGTCPKCGMDLEKRN